MRSIICILLAGTFAACNKYLDMNPNPTQTAPNTVQGMRELMDNNLITENCTPGLGHLGSDDYIMSYDTWLNAETTVKNAYVWQKDIYGDETVLSWSAPYKVVYYCNVVLERLPGVPRPDSATRTEYNAVMGTALFTRSYQFYTLEETFGQIYRPGTAANATGIVLKLTSNPHDQPTRSTVQKVFTQILADAKRSIPLLPDEVQFTHRNRPCKPAAYALLSRVYLTMQEYDSARIYADSCLQYYDKLVVYDTLNAKTARPFPPAGNDEVLYQCSAVSFLAQYYFTSEVDTTLYNSYADNDLRKTIFFRTSPSGTGHYFRGQYTGKVFLFSGVALDEVYLTRAECYARKGDITAALLDLNTLLTRRWKTGTFQPYTATTASEALTMVLAERRKETPFRETRWADLRRLNQDSGTLRRIVGDSVYMLPPGNIRYAYPIPKEEIGVGGIEQNLR
ncbi:MAG: RagB/SusD family nutrient uptake outer membrane protein [Chitinophagaceae bacterium]|nr:RagB/SusD family nutrient uptake outer membrane protein [Chitinophagaceae bacterium]